MKDLKIYVIIASALLVVYLMAQFNKPKATDWTETLVNTDKIPFGTYILYNRINDIFLGAEVKTYREPVYNVMNDEQVKNGTYIIITDEIDLNKYDYDKLLKYIESGNDVFIAASSFGAELNKQLGISASSQYRDNSATRIGFVNNAVKRYLYDVDKHSSDGFFADYSDSACTIIGTNEFKDANYIKYKLGKGNLFLNANPKMFTNYSLLQDMGQSYASIALSFVGNNKYILWDQYYTQGRTGSESDMRVFLENEPLRRAFYIAFFSLVVFVLYQMKRRQRIIPVIEPLINTTVEFAGIVGQVYYEQHNNSNIAQKKVSYFLEYIRTEYGIRTNLFNEEFVTTLSQKSGAEEQLVRQLAAQIVTVRIPSGISDNELIHLNRNIEQFYIQSS